MAVKNFLDTHAVVFLYQGQIEKFSPEVRTIIDSQDIFISPFVKLELCYLHEIKRITKSADHVIGSLSKDLGLIIHNIPLNILIEESMSLTWTRDPFDRLITGHAKAEDARLISNDHLILKHYKNAKW